MQVYLSTLSFCHGFAKVVKMESKYFNVAFCVQMRVLNVKLLHIELASHDTK